MIYLAQNVLTYFIFFFRRETLSVLVGGLRMAICAVWRVNSASSQAHWCQALQVWAMRTKFLTLWSLGSTYEEASNVKKSKSLKSNPILVPRNLCKAVDISHVQNKNLNYSKFVSSLYFRSSDAGKSQSIFLMRHRRVPPDLFSFFSIKNKNWFFFFIIFVSMSLPLTKFQSCFH